MVTLISQTTELRLIGVLEATTQSCYAADIDRALDLLGEWILPGCVNEAQAHAVKDYVGQQSAARAAASANSWTIAGLVMRDTHRKTQVKIYSVELSGETKLIGNAESDERGLFLKEIAGSPPAVAKLEFIDQEELLGSLGPIPTQADQWITWSQSSAAIDRRDGEYEFQRKRLGELFQLGSELEMDEALPKYDAEVLAAHTRFPLPKIRPHQRAAAFAQEFETTSAIGWVLLHACERAGVTDSASWLAESRSAIAKMPPRVIRAEVEQAISSRRISAGNAGNIAQLLDKHRQVRLAEWLSQPAGDQSKKAVPVSKWSDLTEAIGVTKADLGSPGVLFDSDLEEVWPRLLRQVSDPASTLFNEQKAALAAWVEIVGYDHKAIELLNAQSVRHPERAITTRAPGDVAAMLTPHDPALATRVAERLDSLFPGHAVIWESKARLGAGAQSLFDAQLLDLDRLTLAVWNPDGNNDGTSAIRGSRVAVPKVSKAALAELMRLQRLHRLGKTKDATLALSNAGYHSAQHVAMESEGRFIAKMSKQGIGADQGRALQLHAIARQQAATELYVDRVTRRAGVATSPKSAGALDATPTNVPTLAALFGPQDYCECDDCESVVSQAAYLVDQLLWLNRLSVTTGTAYDAFVGIQAAPRRADVTQIELTCPNSEVLVPHIDIVCELLESRIATALGFAQVGPNQTIGTQVEIRAYPEHLNAPVYAALATSIRPGYWPFDAAVAEIRAYCVQKQATYADVVELFGTDGFDLETLALTQSQAAVLTTAATADADQQTIWGKAPKDITTEDLMRTGGRFLGREIAYADVQQLLQIPFVNGTESLAIQLIADSQGETLDTCRADQRAIVRMVAGVAQALDAPPLDCLHRLLLLARTLGWSPTDTGVVLNALGNTIDTSVLAAASRIASKLGVPPLEVAVFFGPFDKDPSTPLGALYRQLFYVRGALPATLGDAVSALGVDTASNTSLLKQLALSAGDPPNVANLAVVFRHVRLAEARGLKLQDYIVQKQVLTDPFAGATGLQIVASLQKWLLDADLLAAGQLSAATLSQLCISTTPDRLDVLWADLLDAQARYPVPLPDPAPDPFADGLWRQAISTWLNLTSSGAGHALDVAGTLFEDQIKTIIAWPVWNGKPPRPTMVAPTGDQETALQVLWRFGTLLQAFVASAADRLPYDQNPALKSVGLTSAWGNLREYLVYFQAGGGTMLPAAELLASDAVTASAGALAAALNIDVANATGLLTKVAAGADGWSTVGRRLGLMTKVSAAVGLLTQVAAGRPTDDTAAQLRTAIQSSIARSQWLAISTAVQNALRVQRRDALLQFLTAFQAKSADNLSADLLIDVETGVLRDRSRIGEACAAIENLITRIDLGLESVDHLGSDLWNQWEWRKRYSTWSGNRLVFLFPENYMSVGTRSTTTPQFQTFQRAVSRGSINEGNVSDALVEYLSSLTELADLEYLAIGSDYDHTVDDAPSGDAEPRALAVVARTRAAPGKYYFNKLVSGSWNFFEELSLGEDPSHIALFSRGTGDTEQNILVWPKATLYPWPAQTIPGSASGSVVDATQTVLSLKFAWTRRQAEGSWTSARTTSGATLHNGQSVTERAVFVELADSEAAGLRPGEFKIVVHLPAKDANDTAAAQMAEMSLRNDTTGKVLYRDADTTRQEDCVWTSDTGPSWKGPAPADELVQQLASSVITFRDLTYVRPWGGLRFNQNRMQSVRDGSNGSVANPLALPNGTSVLTAPATPFSVAALPWRNVSNSTSDLGLTPSPWAFLVSGASWSFFVVEKDKGGTGKVALGLKSSFFDSRPYAAVPAYHPFAVALLARANIGGLPALYQRNVQRDPGDALGATARRFAEDLGLNIASVFVPPGGGATASTQEAIDFSGLAPYQTYNWELFYHAPMQVAVLLSASKRYPEARTFFHYVFNPVERKASGDLGRDWWVTAAFDDDATTDKESLEQIVRDGIANKLGYQVVESSPFDPHKVATGRHAAYERYAVMEYLRNLTAWADSLYTVGGSENVDEADQLYSFAAGILGERPLSVLPVGTRAPLSFGSPDVWTVGGNHLIAIENIVGMIDTVPASAGTAGRQMKPSKSKASADVVHLPLLADPQGRLYFSIPKNEALLEFWDVVEQGQSKVRAWFSLDASGGIVTSVDVAALVSAAAAGGASLSQALSPLTISNLGPRFHVLAAKALEFCADARSLGAGLQAACEKRDAAGLELLRSQWEGIVLNATRVGVESKRAEAKDELDALQAMRDATVQRQAYYSARVAERTSDAEEAAFGLNLAGAVLAGVSSVLELAAAPAVSIPQFTVGAAGAMGSPVATATIGGGNIGGGVQAAARGIAAVGGLVDRSATMVATQAGYDRRAQEWQQQADQAQYEITHIDKQILAAQVRLAIATADLNAHDQQYNSWSAQDDFLHSKFTTEELYIWLLQQTSTLYVQLFQLATDMAKRASAAYAYETPNDTPAPDFSQAAWAADRRGLLAADALAFVLRQMEADHLRLATHDFVVTRRFSLKQLSPDQLIKLRSSASGQTPTCEITLPAWWVVRLDPGLHNRRIRSLSVSVPCLGGPNASVNACLRLATGGTPPIAAISLSTGLNDYGWDTSTRGEHYVPFEGLSLGESDITWKLTFSNYSEVDFTTIADVVLQIEYTADDGGGGGGDFTDPWPMALDLERDASDVWQTLRTTKQAIFDPIRYLPAVLSDHTSMTADNPTVNVSDIGAKPNDKGQIVLDGSSADFSKILGVSVSWKMIPKPATAAAAARP